MKVTLNEINAVCGTSGCFNNGKPISLRVPLSTVVVCGVCEKSIFNVTVTGTVEVEVP
jgi:hypothetical protein